MVELCRGPRLPEPTAGRRCSNPQREVKTGDKVGSRHQRASTPDSIYLKADIDHLRVVYGPAGKMSNPG